jgi:hypothetical protein
MRIGSSGFLLAGIALAGCANRTHAPVAALPAAVKWPVKSPDFVDLLPDWRVREITPIFTSGGFVAKGLEIREGNTITISDTDFEGYETAMYTLKPRPGGGVDVTLESVETNKDGQITKELKPRVMLFQFPRRVRYIRLLYLLRVSTADHNMAVLGSNDVDQLSDLTKQVQTDPAGGCKDLRRAYCRWLPQGIAVTAGATVTSR